MISVEVVKGDLFKSDCEALVNPVNCVGTLGKGLAKTFAQRYPEYAKRYKAQCKLGEVTLGKVTPYIPDPDTFDPDSPCVIFSFPTKKHWRDDSHYDSIREGMQDLIAQVHKLSIKSVAVPALGCGLGNLDWDEVFPIIIMGILLNTYSTHDVLFKIYEPETT